MGASVNLRRRSAQRAFGHFGHHSPFGASFSAFLRSSAFFDLTLADAAAAFLARALLSALAHVSWQRSYHQSCRWSSELLRHSATAKSVLARQAIDEWSRRDKVPYWVIHTMNLVLGDISGPLLAGTTIAFEPIASAGQEFYLEDMFVITKELLTPRVPYSAAEIEAAMRPSAQKP
jgi:hypothetical protein